MHNHGGSGVVEDQTVEEGEQGSKGALELFFVWLFPQHPNLAQLTRKNKKESWKILSKHLGHRKKRRTKATQHTEKVKTI